ncbi:MAG TPA: glycosyltransferase family 2 protein [Candidatus Eremiobacteraeota bacterium]|nr:MAG: Beta-monoglucosyldiacylglycerol synthase [bacterium ADurb.Bin363]HPZ08195.1 glycosyltransferase family 2 protein [Candidatus Eremiobacteraeota bacterium]
MLEQIFLVTYFVLLIILSVFGLHRYLMVYLFYKYKKKTIEPQETFSKLPEITVQLPIFNEMYVIERLIEAVCNFDYPRELLEIQVLDDSTDETCKVAADCVQKYKDLGYRIDYIHRNNREGYKAGALENGLKLSKGEFIVIFDADFVPQPDMLKKTIHFFTDKKIGMVQVRWGHINRDYSFLTKVQSIFLDGHLMMEQTARFRSGRYFNFNGTAGVWRKDCIISSGGWQHDTLTEDLDLSYRAQMIGWEFIFLKDVIAPAEIPVEMNSFKSQQHRWTKGSIQTAKKLLPRISKTKMPLKVKLEALIHMTNNFAYLLMAILSVVMFPALLLQYSITDMDKLWIRIISVDIPIFTAASLSVLLFYMCSQHEAYGNWLKHIIYIPFIMALGVGISINNAKAVLEALLNYKTEFTRTPKYQIENSEDNTWTNKKYAGNKTLVYIIEFVFGLYFTVNLAIAIYLKLYGVAPFLLIYLLGFYYISFMSIFQRSLWLKKIFKFK